MPSTWAIADAIELCPRHLPLRLRSVMNRTGSTKLL
jgi:hypothetical protein